MNAKYYVFISWHNLREKRGEKKSVTDILRKQTAQDCTKKMKLSQQIAHP